MRKGGPTATAPLAVTAAVISPTRPSFRTVWRQQWMLYVMLLPALVLLVLFSFYPLWGIKVAFIDYNPYQGMDASPFVGLNNFQQVFSGPDFWPILRNTVFIAVAKIVVGQIAALVFALMIHQVVARFFNRIVQTITTFPHFLSWVIIGGIMVQLLSSDGSVNNLLGVVGMGPIRFLGDTTIFPWTLIFSETWKEFGFGAVIYLAALTAINPDLYEAAAMDGAGRRARLRHIMLPGIAPTIILLSCLSLGNVLNAGFEQVLVLLNPIVFDTGDIIDTYVYRHGLLEANFSVATAVGLMKSVVGFVLILLSYWLADKFANYRIF